MLTAETITDEQIRELARTSYNTMWTRECLIALGEVTTVNNPEADRAEARARCAEILNTRSAK